MIQLFLLFPLPPDGLGASAILAATRMLVYVADDDAHSHDHGQGHHDGVRDLQVEATHPEMGGMAVAELPTEVTRVGLGEEVGPRLDWSVCDDLGL